MLFTLILSFVLSSVLDAQAVEYNEQQVAEQVFATVAEPSLAPTRLNPNNLGPKITARGAVAIDAQSGQVLWGEAVDARFPIASISKLMTIQVLLDLQPDLDKAITMKQSDETVGGTQYLARGEQVRLRDLIYASLITSANNATEAIVRSSGLERAFFISLMNQKAETLGMRNSNFVEPTGLQFANIASPRDTARLLYESLQYDFIAEATQRRAYEFVSVSGRSHRIFNTNSLLNSYLDILGGKTGFNGVSDYNLATAVQGPEGQEVLVVVLGSETYDSRFQEAKVIADWVFENYEWP